MLNPHIARCCMRPDREEGPGCACISSTISRSHVRAGSARGPGTIVISFAVGRSSTRLCAQPARRSAPVATFGRPESIRRRETLMPERRSRGNRKTRAKVGGVKRRRMRGRVPWSVSQGPDNAVNVRAVGPTVTIVSQVQIGRFPWQRRRARTMALRTRLVA